MLGEARINFKKSQDARKKEQQHNLRKLQLGFKVKPGDLPPPEEGGEGGELNADGSPNQQWARVRQLVGPDGTPLKGVVGGASSRTPGVTGAGSTRTPGSAAPGVTASSGVDGLVSQRDGGRSTARPSERSANGSTSASAHAGANMTTPGGSGGAQTDRRSSSSKGGRGSGGAKGGPIGGRSADRGQQRAAAKAAAAEKLKAEAVEKKEAEKRKREQEEADRKKRREREKAREDLIKASEEHRKKVMERSRVKGYERFAHSRQLPPEEIAEYTAAVQARDEAAAFQTIRMFDKHLTPLPPGTSPVFSNTGLDQLVEGGHGGRGSPSAMASSTRYEARYEADEGVQPQPTTTSDDFGPHTKSWLESVIGRATRSPFGGGGGDGVPAGPHTQAALAHALRDAGKGEGRTSTPPQLTPSSQRAARKEAADGEAVAGTDRGLGQGRTPPDSRRAWPSAKQQQQEERDHTDVSPVRSPLDAAMTAMMLGSPPPSSTMRGLHSPHHPLSPARQLSPTRQLSPSRSRAHAMLGLGDPAPVAMAAVPMPVTRSLGLQPQGSVPTATRWPQSPSRWSLPWAVAEQDE